MRIERWMSTFVLAAAMASSWGCAHGPRSFSKIDSPAPLVRARAVGLAGAQPDGQVLPALVRVWMTKIRSCGWRRTKSYASEPARTSAIFRGSARKSEPPRPTAGVPGWHRDPDLAASRRHRNWPRQVPKQKMQTVKTSLLSEP